MIKPIGNQILVERKTETVSKGGIVIPENAGGGTYPRYRLIDGGPSDTTIAVGMSGSSIVILKANAKLTSVSDTQFLCRAKDVAAVVNDE